MPSRKLNITIAGCGIGGLTTAIALRRAGHKITIYEKSTLSHEVGQGITIAPNGGRILQNLGLDFAKARMLDYLGRGIANAETLEMVSDFMGLADAGDAMGVRMQTAYRIDLHAALVELARSKEGGGEAVEIVTATGVEGFDCETGGVVLSGGRRVEADLVVAADGVKSSAAACINGAECPTLDSSGTIVFRFTLPKEQMLADPLTAPLLDDGPGKCTFHVSPTSDRWLIRYWCRDDGLQNFALYSLRTYEDAERQEDELRFRTDRQSLLDEMHDFHPALRRLAEMTTDVLPLWRCTTREPLKKLHKRRLVVIGDAAHPVKPHVGMGAVSAIEDAGTLGALFEHVPETGDLDHIIEQRLALFAQLRVGRVATYKYLSDVPFFRQPVEEQRENCVKWMRSEDLPATQADFIPWFFTHDAVRAAKQAVARLPRMNGNI